MKLRNRLLALALSAAIMVGGLTPACSAAFSLFKRSSDEEVSESAAEPPELIEEDPDAQTVGVHTYDYRWDFGNGFERNTQITYEIGGTVITIHEEWNDISGQPNSNYPIIWDTTFTLSQPLESICKYKNVNNMAFYVPAGTVVNYAGKYANPSASYEYTDVEASVSEDEWYYQPSFTVESGKTYYLNYAALDSFGISFAAK